MIKKRNKTLQTSLDEIIELAWSDVVSFDEIERLTGLNEQAVKATMRDTLKPSSYRCWRKRVQGRAAKHSRKLKHVPVRFKQPYRHDDPDSLVV